MESRIGGVMFNWWCVLEFNKGNYKLNIKQIVKFVYNYILPVIITVSIVSNIEKDINFKIKDTIINLVIINSFYICIVHVYIQKKFFMKLEREVILRFLPNKASDYIILRVFMIFTKAYLPVIIPSMLFLGMFFANSKSIFYICSLLQIIFAIIINVLIAIYWRYFINTTKEIYVKTSNVIFSISIFILFMLTSNTPVWILSGFESSLKVKTTRKIVELNAFVLFMFILIVILSFVIFKYSKDYFNLRARMLIFNRQVTITKYKGNALNKIQRVYQSVHSISLSTLEKEIFNKDIKEMFRKSGYSILFVIINHIFNIVIIFFFNFSEKVNTVEGSILISKLTTVIIVGQFIAATFISKAAFEKHINIENDFEVLGKYNIKFTKFNVIKAKTRILSTIIFPKIYFIFSILILASLINFNNYLALIYLLSMIQLIFIKKTMELWRVKSINGLNSEGEVISVSNLVGILVTIILFVSVYRYDDKVQYLQGQLVLILITAIMYMFHLTVNNARSEGVEDIV